MTTFAYVHMLELFQHFQVSHISNFSLRCSFKSLLCSSCVSLHPLDLLTFWSAAMINWICTSSFFVDLTHHLLLLFFFRRKKRQNWKLLIQATAAERSQSKQSTGNSNLCRKFSNDSIYIVFRNNYFLHWWYFDQKSWFGVFFSLEKWVKKISK